MIDQISANLVKLTLQLVLIGVAGGAVSWFYSRIQKQRELRISLLKEFAALQGRFVSLRFRFNSFHIEWKGSRGRESHPLAADEIRRETWSHFQEACDLLGEFYGIKPLLVSQFKGVTEEVESIHQTYQQWRRQIGGNQPVLQSKDGKSDREYKGLRERYGQVVKKMRDQI